MKDSKEKSGDKFEAIERWKQSGKTINQFCKEENLSYHKFHYRHLKYQQQNSPSKFIKIKPIARDVIGNSYCELYFANGCRLVFNQKPEADFIKQLL